jgi:multicomponent Na+:H+ antiporter subunit D
VAYLMPIVANAFFSPETEPAPRSAGAAAAPTGIQEAPLACLIPLCLTALGCIALFFFADYIFALLTPIAAKPG